MVAGSYVIVMELVGIKSICDNGHDVMVVVIA